MLAHRPISAAPIAALPVAFSGPIAFTSTAALPLSGSITLQNVVALSSTQALPLGGSIILAAGIALQQSAAMPLGGAVTLQAGPAPAHGSVGEAVVPLRRWERPQIRRERVPLLGRSEFHSVAALPLRGQIVMINEGVSEVTDDMLADILSVLV